MSLINDALKKAQRMRTEGTTSPVDDSAATANPGNEPLQRVARREKPAGFRTQLLLVAGTAVVVVILAGGAFVFFRSGEPAPAPAKPVETAAAPAPAATPASIPATTATAATPVATTQPSPPVATAPVPEPTATVSSNPAPITAAATPSTPPVPATATPAPTTVALPVPAASTPAASEQAPAAPVALKPSSRMIGLIEHLKVGGIRASGAERKVLMNDKVYRLNDIVDHELGIKLTGIETKALTFEDARGAVYTRTF